jgi:LPXTG-motif cell wall-anchored protein
MTVSTIRRLVPAAARLLIAVCAIAGYLAVAQGIASATDASATVNVKCVDAAKSLWSATVTFTNQWDGPTVVTLDASLAAFHASHTLTGNGDTWTPTAFVTSDSAITFRASSDHPEHFHNAIPATVNRPAGCVALATSEPTTPPTTTCEQAIPPRVDCAGPPKAPPGTQAPTTTVAPPAVSDDTPTSIVTTAPAPTVKKAVAPPTTARIALPATGSNGTLALVGAGLAILAAAVILLLVARRPSES